MARTPPKGPHVVDGMLSTAVLDWILAGVQETETNIGSQVSGVAQLAAQTAAQLSQERTDRIANDQAIKNGGGPTETFNSALITNGVSSGATWVSICSVTLTPTGASGSYDITASPDVFINGHLSSEPPTGAVFNGNWQLIEELTAGGTEYVLAMGTFTVTFTPEGNGEVYIPAQWQVGFTGLPASPVAANNSAQSDIRLEIQRASGPNNITAPGLSGSVSVQWNP